MKKCAKKFRALQFGEKKIMDLLFNTFKKTKNLASAFCIILVHNFPLCVQAKGYSIRPNQFDEIVLVEAIEFK